MPLKISQRCKVEQCNVQENKEIYNRLKATLLAMKAQKTVLKRQRDGATKNFQPERRTLWFSISQVDQSALPYP